MATHIMPLLRRLPPERAHALALLALRWLPWADSGPSNPIVATSAFHLDFRNPIGLAAGFDKDAVAIRGLAALGFGCVEVGSVTPRPQPGNPKPRLFRLPDDRAIINRMGMNNAGLQAFSGRLAAARLQPLGAPIGANIAINREGAEPERDYPAMIEALKKLADYVTINVSSPNTLGLRDLQMAERLSRILAAVAAAVPDHPPLLVKLAPDLDDVALGEIVEVAVDGGIAGLILSNTTTSRPPGLRSRHAAETGGLSGAPLFVLATRQLARAYLRARGRLTLVGVGGVASADDAWTKIRAGATLVQLYTAFAEHGPALIPRLVAGLALRAREAGFARVQDAVGADAERLAERRQ